MFYEMQIAGLTRQLPLCKVSDTLYIGAFVIFGDVELTVRTAEALLKKAPEHDVIITAESKGIPIAYEMARQEGVNRYIIARKAPKLYMKNVFTTEVKSITTEKVQVLCLDGRWSIRPAATSWARWPFWPRATPRAGRTSSIWSRCRCSIRMAR